MPESKADLIIHPVRIRIIQFMLGGRKATSQQISEELRDVPHATLYRHINKLAKGGILKVINENQVRGTVERVYALSGDSHSVSPDEFLNASRDDHLRYFVTYMAGLLDTYQRYLQQDNIDLVADLVAYRTAPLYLTDEEAMALLRNLGEVITQAMSYGPGPGRRKRTLSTISIPEPNGEMASGEEKE